MMRYLAIDYGARRTGVAVCDASETVVSPLEVLDSRRGLVERISRIIVAQGAEAVVLGLPLNMDGSEGPQAGQVRAFAEQLRRHIEVPVYFQDERLSSFGAEQKWQESGLGKGRKKARLDALAAAEILQSFLEGRKNV